MGPPQPRGNGLKVAVDRQEVEMMMEHDDYKRIGRGGIDRTYRESQIVGRQKPLTLKEAFVVWTRRVKPHDVKAGSAHDVYSVRHDVSSDTIAHPVVVAGYKNDALHDGGEDVLKLEEVLTKPSMGDVSCDENGI
jgi:hypothetical protein